jgi:hypothetical protein
LACNLVLSALQFLPSFAKGGSLSAILHQKSTEPSSLRSSAFKLWYKATSTQFVEP